MRVGDVPVVPTTGRAMTVLPRRWPGWRRAITPFTGQPRTGGHWLVAARSHQQYRGTGRDRTADIYPRQPREIRYLTADEVKRTEIKPCQNSLQIYPCCLPNCRSRNALPPLPGRDLEAVEFLFPYEYAAGEIRQRLQENQLQLVLFNTPPGDVNAGEWGARRHSGRKRGGPTRYWSWRWVCLPARLPAGAYHGAAWCRRERIAQTARPCSSIICATPRSACPPRRSGYSSKRAESAQTKPGYLYHSQYQTLAMVKRVDRPNLAVQLDLFHAQKVDGNLSHLITEYAGQYRHIQIASLPDPSRTG